LLQSDGRWQRTQQYIGLIAAIFPIYAAFVNIMLWITCQFFGRFVD